MKKQLKKIADIIVTILVIGLVRILMVCPAKTAISTGGFIGQCIYFLGIRKSVLKRNMSAAFPEWSPADLEKQIRKTYRYFGGMFVEMIQLTRCSQEEIISRIDIENPEILDNAVQRDEGRIVASAHFANWELLALILAAKCPDFRVVVKTMKNEYLNRYYDSLHEKLHMKSIYKGSSALTIAKHLHKKSTIGMLMDQSARGQGLFIPFFGRLASFHKIPAILARKTNCPFLCIFLIPAKNNRWILRNIEIPVMKSEDKDQDVLQIVTRYAAELEKIIREYPHYWFWFHDKWKSRPPQEQKS